MAPREEAPIETDEDGWERHPSFGWAEVNRVNVSPPGSSLFDSELRHQQVVVLSIGTAQRRRELNRDWIMEDRASIVDVRMSLAQWGALVSSFGTSGVPVTLDRLDGAAVPSAPHAPRMALSIAEVEGATDKLTGQINEAVEALREAHERKAGRREIGDLLRALEIRLGNAKPNTRFVADSLTEHVENVVAKARSDIEAMVQTAAAHQIETGDVAKALGMGEV